MPDPGVAFDFHPQRTHVVDFAVQNIPGEPVGGNGPAQHAARFGELFKDGDLITALCQIPGGRQARGTGADDGDFFLPGHGHRLRSSAAARYR